jgi:hypothetical protein
MLVRPIGARENSQSLAVIAQPKAETVVVELERGHVVIREEHDVVDGFGTGALAPFAMLIQPHDVAGCVHRIGLRHYGALVPHAQTQGLAVVGGKMRSAVAVAAHLAVGRQAGNEPLQALLTIHTPDGFTNSRPLEVLRRQALIAAPAHRDTRTGRHFKHRVIGVPLHRRKSEIGPKPRAQIQIIDPEDDFRYAEYRHGVLRKISNVLAQSQL